MDSKMWVCMVTDCPSCGAIKGQRCKPLPPPYKQRSTRLEIDYPHVARVRKHNREKRAAAFAKLEAFKNRRGYFGN